MKNNTFVTQTDSKHVKKQQQKAFLGCFGVGSLLACVGFFVAWQTFLFLELLVLGGCLGAFFKKRSEEHSWRLEFKGDELTVINLITNESFAVYDIPASDFVINQTKHEKKLNYCSLMIKDTVFMFGGLEKCEELKSYLKENYEQE